MRSKIRNFEPGAQWSGKDGKPTERAQGWMRDLTDAIPGANGSVTVAGAISETAGGSYGVNEQFMLNDLKTLVNQLRAALVSSGIVV
jgi:hypothetical protein